MYNAFTKEEIEMVKANLQAIKAYCTANIVPHLNRNESISVNANLDLPNRDASFVVSGTGSISLAIGNLVIGFTDVEDERCCDYMHLWPYACKILPCWQEVKQKLHTSLDKKVALRHAMTDQFQI